MNTLINENPPLKNGGSHHIKNMLFSSFALVACLVWVAPVWAATGHEKAADPAQSRQDAKVQWHQQNVRKKLPQDARKAAAQRLKAALQVNRAQLIQQYGSNYQKVNKGGAK